MNRETRRAAERAARRLPVIHTGAGDAVVRPTLDAWPGRVSMRVPRAGRKPLVIDWSPDEADRFAAMLRAVAEQARRPDAAGVAS